MRYGMVIDLRRCIGCHGCQIFCKAENALPPGVLWSRLLFAEEGDYPAVRKTPLPVLCMHCENPPCVEVCPTGAGAKRPDGIVAVDEDRCVGCLNCLAACPYGARRLCSEGEGYFPGQGLTPYEMSGRGRQKSGAVGKCDFCLERIGRGLKPACVENCMAKARYFGDLEDPESEVSRLVKSRKAFRLYPGLPLGSEEATGGANPSVYYLARF